MSDGKKCTKCKVYKPYSEFNKRAASKDGFRSQCKECRKEYRKQNKERIAEYHKEYRENNKEKIAVCHKEYYQNNKKKLDEYYKEYRLANKEKIAEYFKEYRLANKEKIAEKVREYYQKNKKKIADHRKERYQNDPVYKLRYLVSKVVRKALKDNDGNKEGNSTWDALPYTPQQLREHLEAQFEEGMTWDNYGHDGWHIDHIYPQSLLPYESMDDDNFRLAWDLRNLRPLWAAENISKGNEVIEGAEELLLEIKKELDISGEE